MSPTNVTPGSDTSTPAENGVADELNVTVPSAFDVAPPRLVFALAPPARVAAAATATTRMSFLIAPPGRMSVPPGPNGLLRLQSFPQLGCVETCVASAVSKSPRPSFPSRLRIKEEGHGLGCQPDPDCSRRHHGVGGERRHERVQREHRRLHPPRRRNRRRA